MDTLVKDDESKPIIKDGKRGQILRYGEHDIRLIRRELHLAVDEELRFTPEEKEIRKQLMDKVFFRKKIFFLDFFFFALRFW